MLSCSGRWVCRAVCVRERLVAVWTMNLVSCLREGWGSRDKMLGLPWKGDGDRKTWEPCWVSDMRGA